MGQGFNSKIGTEVRDCPGNSMGLGGLANMFPPSEARRRSILHEFGQALGLEHEHQGPAAAFLRLRKKLIKGFYKDEEFVNNVLDRTEEDDNLRYYTNFNPESIMT